MKITKVVHHSVFRIRVDFIYDSKTIGLTKQIEDALWSRNLQACPLPYMKEPFPILKVLFPNVEIEWPQSPSKEIKST